MKIKLTIGIILLLVILVMLIFNNNLKNRVIKSLYEQLPGYKCDEEGLCLKCNQKDGKC